MTFDLTRFLDAQEKNYDQALAEIKRGRKVSHWMWYIFPQIQGLGLSTTSQYYAIQNIDEARVYLHHPILGQRLIDCTSSLLAVEGKTAKQIFGYPDVLKLCSSLTLFHLVADEPDLFWQALEKHFNGKPDIRTLEIAQPE